MIVGAGEPRNEHRHTREHRTDEDDDDEDDLPADTDGRVRGVADEVPDHDVVDNALQSGNDVLQHRRPRQAPDGWTDGTFDDRPIEFSLSARLRHEMRSVLRRLVTGDLHD